MTLLERKKGSTCNCSLKKGSGKAMGGQVLKEDWGVVFLWGELVPSSQRQNLTVHSSV